MIRLIRYFFHARSEICHCRRRSLALCAAATFVAALSSGLTPLGHPVFAQAAAASRDGVPAPLNVSAPPLARTATTIVLLWDRPPGAETISPFQVFNDGKLVGETTRLSFTVRHLPPGKTHRLTVRGRGAAGQWSADSAPVVVTTKTIGAVFNVRDHGARGDGVAKDTPAIAAAIAACTPGGTVLVPPGIYSVDHFELKSDMTLELSTGATLQFLGREKGNYPTGRVTLPGPDGDLEVDNFALISAVRAKNLTITGGGIINGHGESWWPIRPLPRPRVLKLIACSDVFVQGITLDDAPAWNTHVVYADRAVFSEVTFRKVSTARGTNGDGLNPDSCRDVLIVGCTFANQDDSIAIKSGRVSKEQTRRQRSCENITIRDCLVDGKLTPGAHPLGFGIGSETCGGVRHVLIRDCVFRDAASVVNIKANRERLGAIVEDVRVENCTYSNTVFKDEIYNRGPIAIDLFYYGEPREPDSVAPLKPGTPIFRDIYFKNITIENPKGRFVYVAGLRERPLREITFENITGTAKTGFHGQNIGDVMLRGVSVTAAEGPPFVWIQASPRVLPLSKAAAAGSAGAR